MTLSSWTRKYGVPLSPLVDASVERVIDAVSRNCVDDLGGQLDALAAEKPLRQRFLNFDPASRGPWDKLLWDNSKFSLTARAPVLVVQGSADDIVRPAITTEFVRASCRNGAPVQFMMLRGKGHASSIDAAAGPAVAWLIDRLRGVRAAGNCR
jgi:pimeloyl-ACP methyl ester carboxylesterase